MKIKALLTLVALSFPWSTKSPSNSQAGTAAAEKEVLEIEQDQVNAMRKGGSFAAAWLDRMVVDDIAYTAPDGSVLTKAQLQAEYRSGEQKLRSAQHSDYRVISYGDTIVVSYQVNDMLEHQGRTLSTPGLAVDVFVKLNGAWRIVDHQVTPVSW